MFRANVFMAEQPGLFLGQHDGLPRTIGKSLKHFPLLPAARKDDVQAVAGLDW
jgi:hypothetical protein